MGKQIITSPLPFQGQKRNFVKEFKESLKNYPNDAIFVDLFGGSGLLSHVTKLEKPNARVIYNDYDNFKQRLNAIKTTNKILEELRELLGHLPHKVKLNKDYKDAVLSIVKNYDDAGFVDYITLSSNILFSMNYVKSFKELQKETFYNKVRKSNYSTADEYLKGVVFVSDDYKVVFDKYKDEENVVFLVDPPYLSTDSSTYKNYWKLADYLDVLKVLYNNKYFYFTSNKSSVVELCEWIENNTGGTNPFKEAEVKYRYTTTTHNSGYSDIMIHKNWVTNTTF